MKKLLLSAALVATTATGAFASSAIDNYYSQYAEKAIAAGTVDQAIENLESSSEQWRSQLAYSKGQAQLASDIENIYEPAVEAAEDLADRIYAWRDSTTWWTTVGRHVRRVGLDFYIGNDSLFNEKVEFKENADPKLLNLARLHFGRTYFSDLLRAARIGAAYEVNQTAVDNLDYWQNLVDHADRELEELRAAQ